MSARSHARVSNPRPPRRVRAPAGGRGDSARSHDEQPVCQLATTSRLRLLVEQARPPPSKPPPPDRTRARKRAVAAAGSTFLCAVRLNSAGVHSCVHSARVPPRTPFGRLPWDGRGIPATKEPRVHVVADPFSHLVRHSDLERAFSNEFACLEPAHSRRVRVRRGGSTRGHDEQRAAPLLDHTGVACGFLSSRHYPAPPPSRRPDTCARGSATRRLQGAQVLVCVVRLSSADIRPLRA